MRGHAPDQSLESIAGKPVGRLRGVGQLNNLTPNTPLSPMTVYCLYEADGSMSSAFGTLVTVRDASATGRVSIQTRSAGIDGMNIRVDTTELANQTSSTAALLPSRTTGQHVATVQINAGATLSSCWIDSGPNPVTRTTLPGEGVYRGVISVAASGTSETFVREVLVYNAAHDATTRRRIEAWLRNRSYTEPLVVQTGPIGSLAGVPDGIYSVPAELGPSGKAIGRITKNGDPNQSYGAYVKAARSANARSIPAGVQVNSRVWVRTNYTGTFGHQAINDQGTYFVANNITQPCTADTWQLVNWTFTTLLPFRASESIRTGIGAGAGWNGRYVDFSDPVISIVS